MKNIRNIYILIAAALLLVCSTAEAQTQKWAISTNALSWVNLGTMNAEGSVSLNDNFTLVTGFTANPWQLKTPTSLLLKNQQYGGYVGAKYWPWHVYSEWWVGAKLQYKNFEQVGLMTSSLIEGNALGAGLSGGYSLIMGKHFNIDFGLGLWGGRLLTYKKYKKDEADQTKIVDQGPRNFVFLDNIMVSLVYIF